MYNKKRLPDGKSLFYVSELLDFFDQAGDDLVLAELADDLAAADEHRFAFAARNADVRLARLARTVDHAAHQGNRDRLIQDARRGCRLLKGVRKRDQVDFCSAAGGAGNDVQPLFRIKAEGKQDVVRGGDFLHWVFGERNAHRVADAAEQGAADTDRALDQPHSAAARLGHADVQRIIGLFGKDGVCRRHGGDVRGLDREHNVVKIKAFEQRGVVERALGERFRSRRAVFCENFFLQRAAVDADADRHMMCAAGYTHFIYTDRSE